MSTNAYDEVDGSFPEDMTAFVVDLENLAKGACNVGSSREKIEALLETMRPEGESITIWSVGKLALRTDPSLRWDWNDCGRRFYTAYPGVSGADRKLAEVMTTCEALSHCNRIVLLSGDHEFVAPLKRLKGNARIHVVGHRNSIHKKLLELADKVTVLNDKAFKKEIAYAR
jgi:hypothetical protein